MSAVLLEGRPVARGLIDRACGELTALLGEYGTRPRLAVLQVGDDLSASAYRDSILRVAANIGIDGEVIGLPADTDEASTLNMISELNANPAVNGIIVLQPLPPQLARVAIADHIDPLKDVDGITTFNAGRLFHDDLDVLAPSTPAGGMALLKHYDVPLAGKHAVVVGRSPVVGKPMAMMLMAEHATVTMCHSRTADLAYFTRQADILVAAAGQPGLITANMVRRSATVLDFGVSFVDGQMRGDVDAASVADVASGLTPVPGGTGRVTPVVLVRNTLKAARLQLRSRIMI
jgi:methylenetetrahydrofolate dehydrogenase (NADP+)/methenyltetrahydrofolate cyclohydrolase